MKDIIICRCEGVYLSEILKAIEDGSTAIPGIKKRIRASMGSCQGRVCQPVIRDILLSKTGESTEPSFQRYQSPVRPTLIRDL